LASTSAAPYTGETWQTPANAGADDTAYAVADSANFDTGVYTFRLDATNFGFSIPAGATIDGVVVEIEYNGAKATDALVQLIQGGTPAGTNNSVGAAIPATDTINTYGSSSDKWGSTWTVADITASNFGVAYAAISTGQNSDVSVDFIRITVHYTPVPDISNTPTSYPFGTVAESSTTSTGLTHFTVTNNSAFNVNISISAGNMTGGVTWTLSDTATPGTNIYGLKAGTAAVYDTIVTSGGVSFITNLAASGGTQTWGLQLLAPDTFTDGGAKTGTVTLTATVA